MDKESRIAWVYITTNLITGKKYIGQTVTPITDRRNYIGSGHVISRAIKKYGKENFIREDVFAGDEEAVDLVESMYIEKYNAVTSQQFYNLKEGGHHGRHGEISKLKMSESAKLRKDSDETRKVKSQIHSGENNHFYGKTHSEESKQKIKAARKKQIFSEETNIKRSESIKSLPRFQCVKCGGLYFKRNLVQHHNEKCKKGISC